MPRGTRNATEVGVLVRTGASIGPMKTWFSDGIAENPVPLTYTLESALPPTGTIDEMTGTCARDVVTMKTRSALVRIVFMNVAKLRKHDQRFQ